MMKSDNMSGYVTLKMTVFLSKSLQNRTITERYLTQPCPPLCPGLIRPCLGPRPSGGSEMTLSRGEGLAKKFGPKGKAGA